MADFIPQTFKDELLNRIDLVDLIDRRVGLKKTGKNFSACCPFHSEKTPSFVVNPEKQFYYCFGCEAHGNAISFLIDYDNLSYVEAIEELAHMLGMEIPRESRQHYVQDKFEPLYEILEKAALFYQQQLRSHPAAAMAVNYLKNRGLSGDIAQDFAIGFAPPGWTPLSDQFKTAAEHKALHLAGLIIKKDNGQHYDRFRNRVMFPILDRRGRVIAFGGRVINKEDQPKYLNSPETPVFQKSKELYGFYEARKRQRQLKRFLVVEGYMDVVALAQYELNYAVATLGTATSKEHIQTLYRSVSDIIFCFDGDNAGRKAAWRAMENSLELIKPGRALSFLFLPEGEDPDTMIRKEGKQAFEKRLDTAQPLSEFMINTLAQGIDITHVDGKARFLDRFKPLAKKLPDEIFKDLLIDKITEFLQTSQNLINKSLEREKPSENQVTASQIKLTQQKNRTLISRTRVRTAIALLLQYPKLAIQVENSDILTTIKLPGIEILHRLFTILKTDPDLKPAALLERFRGTDDYHHLSKLAALELVGNPENLQIELIDILEHFKQQTKHQRWLFLQQKASELGLDGLDESEKMEYRQLLVRQSETDS